MPLLGVHLSSGHLDPTYYHSWPLDASTGGNIWPKVSQTQKLTKYQADPMLYHSWPPDASTRGVHLSSGQLDPTESHSWSFDASMGGSVWLKCKKDIWKFEHTWGFGSCITEVFSTKNQQCTMCLSLVHTCSYYWTHVSLNQHSIFC